MSGRLRTTCGRCGREYVIPAEPFTAAKHTCPDGVTLDIHEPDPDYWLHPDAFTITHALVLAEESVKKTKEAHLICAVIYEGELAFQVMLTSAYAALREKEMHERLAPVCSLLPNGTIEMYSSLAGINHS